ncbi:TlpA disulfide reductase family protein [Pedobacter heparinus]|uniref:TlpA disulfide reductase family protein n=1 Tax=Pedobacter heparinus TaxID=984 RepID=UPI00292FE399|nr:TlpA disulfide reductase family protein [Pedobacter heparinus]
MKKLLTLLLVIISYVSASGQYKFTLDFKIKTFNNAKIYLNVYNSQSFVPIKRDSFIVVNGRQTIKGELKQPSNFADFFVSYQGKGIGTRFVLDSGENKVSLDTPVLVTKTLTLLSNARGHLVVDELDNLFLEMAAQYKEPTRVNGYLKIPPKLHEQIKEAQLKRLLSYPNDYGSLLYLYRISRIDAESKTAMDILVTLETFSEELRNSTLGKQLYEKETDLINNKKAAGAGNKVPIFKINDLNNNTFTNSSLIGQPYIIVFSATWCGPCQEQLPMLKQLYETYKQKGLKVIYFNDDDNVIR